MLPSTNKLATSAPAASSAKAASPAKAAAVCAQEATPTLPPIQATYNSNTPIRAPGGASTKRAFP